MMCCYVGVITQVQLLGGLPLKIWEGKKCAKIGVICNNFCFLMANISGTEQDVKDQNGS